MNKCPLCADLLANQDTHENIQFHKTIDKLGNNKCSCDNCGQFSIADIVFDDNFNGQLNDIEKIRISYDVRRHSDQLKLTGTHQDFRITQEYIDHRKSNNNLPNPAEQAENLIRFLGDELNKSIEPLETLPNNLYLKIGAKSPFFCAMIVKELHSKAYITGHGHEAIGYPFNILNPSLSLDGWEKYALEKKGGFSGKYAFIAYKFDENDFEQVLENHIRNMIPNHFNIGVRDMKGHTEAGIIDNIMRQQIRDSAFVIADLSHNNNGAYWEAGYAEGLGKPVIYTCNQEIFNEKKTHFDTNHCTTVMWHNDEQKNNDFENILRATIRRSLNLFD